MKGIVKSKLPVHVISPPQYSKVTTLSNGVTMIKRGMGCSQNPYYYGSLCIREDGKDVDVIVDVPLNIYLNAEINKQIEVNKI